MTKRRAFRFRLRFKGPGEAVKLYQFAGCCRFVWNKALSFQLKRLEQGKRCLSYPEMASLLLKWKKEHPFLKEVPSQALQQRLRDLDKALKDAFDADSAKKFPRFKKKYRCLESLRYPQGFQITGSRIFLPKFGWARFFKSRDIEGIPKNVTVSLRGDHWFIAIQTEQDVPVPVHGSATAVGVDFGVVRLATLSDGTFYMPVNAYEKYRTRLAKAQRRLARQVKGSNNYKKQRSKVKKIHIRIADTRLDHLHKVSHAISKNHAMVVREDLHVKNMSKSAKGTTQNPGKHVRRKSGLNRAILDQGWGEFRRQMEYKELWGGGLTFFVDPAYSSQECSHCGYVSADNRPSRELFYCERCGHTAHADENAAKVVLGRVGHTRIACESNGFSTPLETGTYRVSS